MPETFPVPSTEALPWPRPPGCPADELTQVLGEHELLDDGCRELIEVLRSRRQVGQSLHAPARALAQRLVALQGERRAQLGEQLAELHSLHERSTARLQMLQQRVNQDAERLRDCGAQLDALRTVHARMAQELLAGLHAQTVHVEMRRMREESGKPWQRPARMGRAFAALSERLHLRLAQAQRRCEEIHGVMALGYAQISATHGLALAAEAAPPMQPFIDELTVLSGAYARHMGLGNLLRLVRPGFQAWLLRQLQSRLVRLFHGATSELEQWSHALWTPAQVRLEQSHDRLQHRRDAVQRVCAAADELQQRIGELEAQELLEQESFGHALRLLARLEAEDHGDSPQLQARAA